MKNLEDLEKKINSELTTKINNTEIKHNQIYSDIACLWRGCFIPLLKP